MSAECSKTSDVLEMQVDLADVQERDKVVDRVVEKFGRK